MSYEIKVLKKADAQLMYELMDCFSSVFEEPENYSENRPSIEYVQSRLDSDNFIALVALVDGKVAGALTGYELKKFEQERSELYIYDLAVYPNFRRQGIATALINATQQEAKERGTWVVYVQADYEDEPAVRLYSKLGHKEEVLHFDIPVET